MGSFYSATYPHRPLDFEFLVHHQRIVDVSGFTAEPRFRGTLFFVSGEAQWQTSYGFWLQAFRRNAESFLQSCRWSSAMHMVNHMNQTFTSQPLSDFCKPCTFGIG